MHTLSKSQKQVLDEIINSGSAIIMPGTDYWVLPSGKKCTKQIKALEKYGWVKIVEGHPLTQAVLTDYIVGDQQ